MESRVTTKITNYIDDFKTEIKEWVENKDTIDFSTKSEILKFIYDYESLTLEKEDFSKRKRIKSVVPYYLRCMAKRANGEQCTRKKKNDACYCGTHDKNRPHGEIDSLPVEENKLKKMEVWLQEITGILYYIDAYNNIYLTEDIIANKINPSIIAKYKIENDIYIFQNL